MANALYTQFVNSYMTQAANQVNLVSDTIKVTAVDLADYTLDIANHDFFNDIPMAARVATATLAGKTVTGRTFDATDTTLSGVTGDQFEALVIWKDTGVESTSRLIAFIDTATGLAMTPSGSDIIIQWNAAGIFTL